VNGKDRIMIMSIFVLSKDELGLSRPSFLLGIFHSDWWLDEDEEENAYCYLKKKILG